MENKFKLGDLVFIRFDDRKEYRLGLYLRGTILTSPGSGLKDMFIHNVCYLNKAGNWSVKQFFSPFVRLVKEDEREEVFKMMELGGSNFVPNKKLYTYLASTFANFDGDQQNLF